MKIFFFHYGFWIDNLFIENFIHISVEDFRKFLLKELTVQLRDHGFVFTEPDMDGIASFDLAAKRDDDKFIVKIVYNIDTIREENAIEMNYISKLIGCIALVIGKRASNGDLENNIVYYRHEIPIMTYDTFIDYMNGSRPYIYSAHGGYYVSIKGDSLRNLREKKRYSIGYVSGAVGVSRRSISLYETGTAATLDVYMKLQRLFSDDIKKTIDLLSGIRTTQANRFPENLQNDFFESIFSMMRSLGFEMFPFRKTPFDAMASDNAADQIMLGLAEQLGGYRKAKAIANLSKLFERDSLVVSREKTDKSSIQGCPVVNYSDMVEANRNGSLDTLLRKKTDSR